LNGLFHLGAITGDDDERQHSAERDGTAGLAQFDELVVHLRRGGGRQVDDQGRLQDRPVRANIWSADDGPQVPALYCSGLPRSAQCSSTGSRIFQESSTSSFTGNNEGSPSNTSSRSRS